MTQPNISVIIFSFHQIKKEKVFGKKIKFVTMLQMLQRIYFFTRV